VAFRSSREIPPHTNANASGLPGESKIRDGLP